MDREGHQDRVCRGEGDSRGAKLVDDPRRGGGRAEELEPGLSTDHYEGSAWMPAAPSRPFAANRLRTIAGRKGGGRAPAASSGDAKLALEYF